MSFAEGQQFLSFEEVERYRREYEDLNYCQLTTSHARTLEGARKRGMGVNRYMNPNLKYYELTYKCIHGGSYESRSKGKRPNQSTFRQGCPFMVRLRASLDGTHLKVLKVDSNHSHPLTEGTFSHLPRQRRLDEPVKEFVQHVMKLGCNKKLLQAELLPSQRVTLKDLHNLSAQSREKDSLDSCLKYLTAKENGIVEVVQDESNVLMGIFYQDEEMRRLFQCYPEIIFIDAIYKVSNMRIPLYIFAIEDGNSETEIVAFFLATREDKVTITKMVKLFKRYNDAWVKTKSIMSDKDFQERSAFRVEFPNASLLICLFHSLRSFRREITTDKLGISKGERDLALEIVQNMAYAKNEEVFEEHWKTLRDLNNKALTAYIEKNWHPIRSEWVISLQPPPTFGNRTNNRLESMNSKLLQVVKKFSSLPDLFRNIDILLMSLRNERDNVAAQMCLKIPIVQALDEHAQKYMEILTPYAYGLVMERINMLSKVKFEHPLEDVEFVKVTSSSGVLSVSTTSCTCAFKLNYELPCHHLLKVREIKGLSLYDDVLVSQRWTKKFYIGNSRISVAPVAVPTNCSLSTVKTSKILSQGEKIRFLTEKAKAVVSLASEAPSRLFSQRVNVLERLIQYWSQGIEVHVAPIESSSIIAEETAQSITEEMPTLEEPPHQMDSVEQLRQPVLEMLSDIQNMDVWEPIAGSSQHMDHVVQLETPLEEMSLAVEPVLLLPGPLEEAILIEGVSQSTGELVQTIDFSNLPLVPHKLKKRGRPKGLDTTVIGLKRRNTGRLVAFERKSRELRDRIMLSWFATDVDGALKGETLISREHVKQNANLVSSACIDESVNLQKIRTFFTEDGWQAVLHILDVKRKSPLWLCPVCQCDVGDSSICCNSCLEWLHLACSNLKEAPKQRQWFCKICKRAD